MVAQLFHSFKRVFFEHWLDGKTLGLDDCLARLGLGLGAGFVGRRLRFGNSPGPRFLYTNLATRFLSGVDYLAFDAIDHGIQACLVRWPGGMAAQRLTVDGERDLRNLRVVSIAMRLARK